MPLIQLSCGFVRQVAALQRTNATLLQKLDASVAEIARLRKGGGDVVVKELSGNPAGWCALCRRSRHPPPPPNVIEDTGGVLSDSSS